ncbi:DUF6274 family protein [Streptomyces sp. 891-h]|uniref:DUF6274 family protein n=1 Tax=unclassified Streptomyces TaxID=2593676 RepID=UPI001FA95E47|nr:DUF6274 family protein [Streptomyces sp. 891-h]UNZ15708.1 hypothetical protein HC362_15460 [Streptomyces sp. 891-h]
MVRRRTVDEGRQELRALLRSHLAGRRHHASRHCAVCHRLLRLAMASATPPREGGWNGK